MGGPERTPPNRKKSPRNTVTATIIFSYIILTSSFDVITFISNETGCSVIVGSWEEPPNI